VSKQYHRAYGPNPFPADSMFGAQWEANRALRNLGWAIHDVLITSWLFRKTFDLFGLRAKWPVP
jgi:hypothetical protein